MITPGSWGPGVLRWSSFWFVELCQCGHCARIRAAMRWGWRP